MDISSFGAEVHPSMSQSSEALRIAIQDAEENIQNAQTYEQLSSVLAELEKCIVSEILELSNSEQFGQFYEDIGAVSGAENIMNDFQRTFFPERSMQTGKEDEQVFYIDPWVRYINAVSEYVKFLQSDLAPNLATGRLRWIHKLRRPPLGRPIEDQKYQVLLQLLDQLQKGSEHMKEMGMRMELADMGRRESEDSKFIIFNNYFLENAVPLMNGESLESRDEKGKIDHERVKIRE